LDIHPQARLGESEYGPDLIRDVDDTRYSLELNGKQAACIRQALDLYGRILCGQVKTVREPFLGKDYDYEKVDALLAGLKTELFPELQTNASYGIFNQDADERAKVSWDILQVIRNRLAWDRACNPSKRNWKGMMGVSYDDPLLSSKEPICKMMEMKEDEH